MFVWLPNKQQVSVLGRIFGSTIVAEKAFLPALYRLIPARLFWLDTRLTNYFAEGWLPD